VGQVIGVTTVLTQAMHRSIHQVHKVYHEVLKPKIKQFHFIFQLWHITIQHRQWQLQQPWQQQVYYNQLVQLHLDFICLLPGSVTGSDGQSLSSVDPNGQIPSGKIKQCEIIH